MQQQYQPPVVLYNKTFDSREFQDVNLDDSMGFQGVNSSLPSIPFPQPWAAQSRWSRPWVWRITVLAAILVAAALCVASWFVVDRVDSFGHSLSTVGNTTVTDSLEIAPDAIANEYALYGPFDQRKLLFAPVTIS